MNFEILSEILTDKALSIISKEVIDLKFIFINSVSKVFNLIFHIMFIIPCLIYQLNFNGHDLYIYHIMDIVIK